MTDDEFRKLDIASRIAPTSASWPTDQPYVHWTRLTNTVEEARARLDAYYRAKDEINGDPRLSNEGKREERLKAAQKALGAFNASKSLQRAQQSVGDVMAKWDAQLKAAIKPAANEAEAMLHGEIRKHIAALKGGQRMSFLEQHASDPIVASAVLEAPPFLTGLTPAEALMVKHKIEATVLPREIGEAKNAVSNAMTDTEHGWNRAQTLIGEDAGLHKGADGTWTQPAKETVAA